MNLTKIAEIVELAKELDHAELCILAKEVSTLKALAKASK